MISCLFIYAIPKSMLILYITNCMTISMLWLESNQPPSRMKSQWNISELYFRSRLYINLQQTRTHHDQIYLKTYSLTSSLSARQTYKIKCLKKDTSESLFQLLKARLVHTEHTRNDSTLWKVKSKQRRSKSSILHFRLPVFNSSLNSHFKLNQTSLTSIKITDNRSTEFLWPMSPTVWLKNFSKTHSQIHSLWSLVTVNSVI